MVREFPALLAGAGWQEVVWNGDNSHRQKVKAGLYYICCRTASGESIGQIVVLQ
jgi:hypothetical protein